MPVPDDIQEEIPETSYALILPAVYRFFAKLLFETPIVP